MNKRWHILNVNNTFGNVFKATPAIAFRKKTSLRQIIGINRISHNQKLLTVKQNVTKECIPCNTLRCLSCQQIIATTTFESIQAKEKFNIYHKISCQSNYIISLLDNYLSASKMSALQNIPCQKVRNSLSLKLEPRRGYKKSHAIKAYKHLNNWKHVFHKDGKLIIIEQLKNIKNT